MARPRLARDAAMPQGFRGRARAITAVALAICLAAYNSGNNVFYLVASVLFATVLLSAWRGRRVLRAVWVKGYPGPEGLFAGRPGPIALEVSAPEPLALHLSHASWSDGVATDAHPAGSRAEAAMVPARRGWDRLDALRVVSRGPFGITTQHCLTSLATPLLVFPEPEGSYDLEADAPLAAPRPLVGTGVPGIGGDFLAVRDYRPEDGVRRVYWRGLARTGRLLSTVTEREDDAALTLVLSNLIEEDSPARRRAFESALSRVTAAVLQAHERGVPYRLVTPEGAGAAGTGARHRHEVLSRLALLEPRVARATDWRPPRGVGVIEFGAEEDGVA